MSASHHLIIVYILKANQILRQPQTLVFFSQFSRIYIVAQEHLFQDVTQPGEGSTSTLLCDPVVMGTQ